MEKAGVEAPAFLFARTVPPHFAIPAFAG